MEWRIDNRLKLSRSVIFRINSCSSRPHVDTLTSSIRLPQGGNMKTAESYSAVTAPSLLTLLMSWHSISSFNGKIRYISIYISEINIGLLPAIRSMVGYIGCYNFYFYHTNATIVCLGTDISATLRSIDVRVCATVDLSSGQVLSTFGGDIFRDH